jgi:hypothetical protein
MQKVKHPLNVSNTRRCSQTKMAFCNFNFSHLVSRKRFGKPNLHKMSHNVREMVREGFLPTKVTIIKFAFPLLSRKLQPERSK